MVFDELVFKQIVTALANQNDWSKTMSTATYQNSQECVEKLEVCGQKTMFGMVSPWFISLQKASERGLLSFSSQLQIAAKETNSQNAQGCKTQRSVDVCLKKGVVDELKPLKSIQMASEILHLKSTRLHKKGLEKQSLLVIT